MPLTGTVWSGCAFLSHAGVKGHAGHPIALTWTTWPWIQTPARLHLQCCQRWRKELPGKEEPGMQAEVG